MIHLPAGCCNLGYLYIAVHSRSGAGWRARVGVAMGPARSRSTKRSVVNLTVSATKWDTASFIPTSPTNTRSALPVRREYRNALAMGIR